MVLSVVYSVSVFSAMVSGSMVTFLVTQSRELIGMAILCFLVHFPISSSCPDSAMVFVHNLPFLTNSGAA